MRVILLATVLAAAALPADASVKSYEFRVNLTSGPLAGKSIHGSFGVDSSLVTGTNDYYDAAGLGITAIDFNLGGFVQFTRVNADASFLSFTKGVLTDFSLGGQFSGVDLIDANNPSADFLLSSLDVSYNLPSPPGLPNFIYGGDTIHFQAVPEPAALALFGLSLGALCARRVARRD